MQSNFKIVSIGWNGELAEVATCETLHMATMVCNALIERNRQYMAVRRFAIYDN